MSYPHLRIPLAIFEKDPPPNPPRPQPDCDGGDCACSFPSLSLPNLRQTKTEAALTLRRSPDSQKLTLDEEYAIFYGPFHLPIVLNQEAQVLASLFEQPTQIQTVVADKRGEYEDVVYKAVANMCAAHLLIEAEQSIMLTETPKTLSTWMHITDRCNLRCEYCYLPHLRQDMSLEIGKAAIHATFRSALAHHYSMVKIKYAGGEPLLCFPLIKELHQFAISLSRDNGLELDEIILTNGTLLTHDIAQEIHSLGIRVMISLDGLGQAHNAQRPYVGGQGSFKAVVRGIEIAQQHGLIPDISITVTGKSAHKLPEIIEWVLERKLPFNLNFYRENELSTSHADLKLDEDAIIQGMLSAYKVVEAYLPRYSLLASLVDRANLSAPHTKTCGVGDNYMVFDHKGRISKCQMHIHKAITTVDVIDPLVVIRSDIHGIQNISVEEKEICRSCEWKYWCTGGCSLATFKATGRYDISSPNCNIYRTLYPEVMRLEGLRLLRYGEA